MEKDSQCTVMRYRQEEATNRLQATEDGPLNCSYFRIPSHISLGICSKFPFLRSTLQQERKEGSVLAVRLVLEKLLPLVKSTDLESSPSGPGRAMAGPNSETCQLPPSPAETQGVPSSCVIPSLNTPGEPPQQPPRSIL